MHEILEMNRQALAIVCAKFHVARLDIFGSAASGAFDPESSDLDFLVDFNRVDSMTLADQYFGLLAALEELFGRSVDLLTSRSLRNPYLIDGVEKTRRMLYAA